jgi:RNA polymerase sigma factor (TIGR02999 family)
MAIVGGVPDSETGEIPSHLFALVYDELRRIAHRQRRGIGAPPTLNTTALVHEAYLKLSPAPEISALTRPHFLALAARAMRQVLVDHARSRAAIKRGGEISFTEDGDEGAGPTGDVVNILALDDALRALTKIDPRAGRVVEWHVFGGLSLEQIAELQGVVLRTTFRDWRRARAFLISQLDLPDPIVIG